MLNWLRSLSLLAQLALGAGAVLGAGGVVAGAYAFVWHQGHAAAAAECQEGALRARIAELEFDLQLAKEQAEFGRRLNDVLMERADLLEERMGDFDAGDYCRVLDDAGARRLQELVR